MRPLPRGCDGKKSSRHQRSFDSYQNTYISLDLIQGSDRAVLTRYCLQVQARHNVLAGSTRRHQAWYNVPAKVRNRVDIVAFTTICYNKTDRL